MTPSFAYREAKPSSSMPPSCAPEHFFDFRNPRPNLLDDLSDFLSGIMPQNNREETTRNMLPATRSR